MRKRSDDQILGGASYRSEDGAFTREPGGPWASVNQTGGPPWPGSRQRAARSHLSGGTWIALAKAICVTVLAMFIAADVGVNLAHNAAAAVSRVVPFMDNRPFELDPLAVVHDLETLAR